MGADNIVPTVCTKLLFHILSKPLHHFYSMFLRYATLENSQDDTYAHIFKSGKWNSVKCYCTISLQSNISNLLELLFYSKIVSKITDSFNNAQVGFLKNHFYSLQKFLCFTISMNFSLVSFKLTPSILI